MLQAGGNQAGEIMGIARRSTRQTAAPDCAEAADLAQIAWERVSRFHRPEDSLAYLLWHVTHGWIRKLNATLAPLGMTHLQFILMASTAWLARSGSVSQSRLAHFCTMDPMLISKTLRTLERHGMILRKNDPTDSRAKQLMLTKRGLSQFIRAVPDVELAYEEFFAPIGKATPDVHRALLQLFYTVKTESSPHAQPVNQEPMRTASDTHATVLGPGQNRVIKAK
jgi:DNA-binding MarR family transcriptional regulator